MGVGDNFRSSQIVQGMPLGAINTQVLLSADNQVVDAAGMSLIYIGSDNTTAANRTFTLLPSPLVGHQLTLVFYTGSSTTCQLVDTGAMRLGSDWTPTQYDLLVLMSDGTNWLEVARGPVTFSAGAVLLANLATGISPSHVVKYAGTATTVGGAAAEAITVAGLLASDVVSVTLRTKGGTPRTIVTAIPSANTLTVTFSGDPSNDHVVDYVAFRAAT